MLKRNNSEKICNLVLCSKCYSKALTAALLHAECFTVMGSTLQQVIQDMAHQLSCCPYPYVGCRQLARCLLVVHEPPRPCRMLILIISITLPHLHRTLIATGEATSCYQLLSLREQFNRTIHTPKGTAVGSECCFFPPCSSLLYAPTLSPPIAPEGPTQLNAPLMQDLSPV